jgi:hypothetical protein
MVFNNNLLLGAAGAGAVYEIDQSIRFNDDDSSHLYRDQGAGDKRKATFSCWMKLGAVLSFESIWTVRDNATNPGDAFKLYLQSDTLKVQNMSGAANDWQVVTSQLFRDPSAWYHVVLSVDTDQATDTNRVKVYVNGTQASFSSASYPAVNADQDFGSAFRQWVGVNRTDAGGLNGYFDGYLAEIHFIDGTALDATSFGETNDDGVWIPKAYTGSYGTNGFYITGADSADLGADDSGNGNDFTSSGLTTADQMLDTPTLNYATLNTLDKGSTATLSDGGLVYGTTGETDGVRGSIGLTTGKWYWEVLITASVAARTAYVGFGSAAANLATGNAPTDGSYYGYISYTGNKQHTASTAYGDTFSINETVGIALNLDDGEVTFYNEGISQGVAFTGIDLDTTWFPMIYVNDTIANFATFNFGQSAFTYTPPAGFLELNTANLSTPSITDGSAHFQPTLYTGTGSSLAVTQSGNSTFQPDWVWIKGRSGSTEHVLTDAVRGVTKELSSNDTGAEETVAQGLTTFGSAGFTVGTDGSYNTSSATYVGWQWKANGAGSSNTDGSINTTATSANTTAGFSISTYTGTGSAATIGHGLGIAPKMVIVKKRVAGTDDAWVVWHASLPGANYYLNLNDTGAQDTSVNYWNNTLPTSSVFSVGASNGTNENTKTFVAYCFAEIPGYSSFGSYTGNGSSGTGPFIYLGFKPAFLMVKRTNAAYGWIMLDATRDSYNLVDNGLFADAISSEATVAAGYSADTDFLSNGFKPQVGAEIINASGGSYIYIAFAENPFGGDGAAPATAR